jgi:hypothetical protein
MAHHGNEPRCCAFFDAPGDWMIRVRGRLDLRRFPLLGEMAISVDQNVDKSSATTLRAN